MGESSTESAVIKASQSFWSDRFEHEATIPWQIMKEALADHYGDSLQTPATIHCIHETILLILFSSRSKQHFSLSNPLLPSVAAARRPPPSPPPLLPLPRRRRGGLQRRRAPRCAGHRQVRRRLRCGHYYYHIVII